MVLGGLIGAVGGAGLVLVAARISALRRPQLAERVLPYLRDLPVRDQGPALRPVSRAVVSTQCKEAPTSGKYDHRPSLRASSGAYAY